MLSIDIDWSIAFPIIDSSTRHPGKTDREADGRREGIGTVHGALAGKHSPDPNRNDQLPAVCICSGKISICKLGSSSSVGARHNIDRSVVNN